jgi:hypothetical protein
VLRRRLYMRGYVGVVKTIAGSGSVAYADGWGTNGAFSSPRHLYVTTGAKLYVADSGNYRIRVIDLTGSFA